VFGKHFLLQNACPTTSYPHDKEKVESTNKEIGNLMTKLVNEKIIVCDKHLTAILISC
jgi:hypothetical protein